MIEKSYISNYINTYLWQGLAILFNLTSMFIVIPYISENKVIFGIYSVCISTSIFLNYADIGFVSAAIKYAGESFARGEKERELEYYGLAGFILFILISLIASMYVILAMNPAILIAGIENSKYLTIATLLLCIQAIFSYNNILQRFVTSVFQVRIEQYIYQRVNIVANLLKILSVFYFFRGEHYQIVEYFLFTKIIELIALLFSLLIIRIKHQIHFKSFIKVFHFDKEIYEKTKGLAYSSLFVTIMWIAFYELDLVVIGRIYGADLVAIYAISFTLIKFLRSITSVLYSPFKSRYNHLVGLGQSDRLGALLSKVILFTMPLIVMIVLSIIVLSKNIILTWAGAEYIDSSILLALLSASYLFSFIRIPGANMMVALEKIKEMYLINALMVLIFWGGIILTSNYWGVGSFAIFKLLAGIFATAFYLRILVNYLDYGYLKFFKHTVGRMIFPLFIQIIFLLGVIQLLPNEKSLTGLIEVVAMGALSVLLGLIVLYFSSMYYRGATNIYFKKMVVGLR